MKISIITGAFMPIPPYSIGAVEKLWYELGKEFEKNNDVCFISKRCSVQQKNNNKFIYIKGYNAKKNKIYNLVLDFIYSYRALRYAPQSDIVILNSILSPVLYPLFRKKLKYAIYNIARIPKKQLFLYRNVDILSCVSSAVYNIAMKQTPSLKGKYYIVNNPINTDVFNMDKEKSCNIIPTVIYTGRINKEKGLDILVKAVNILNEDGVKVNLNLIGATAIAKGGSGPDYVKYLNDLAVYFKIKWVDPIYSPVDLANAIRQGDIFCYPSVAEAGETFGVSPLEAMGLGLPTIVSDLDCFKDFIKDNQTGLVFNHRQKSPEKELSQLIYKIINSKDLYHKLSINGYKISRKFSNENIAKQYLDIFKKLTI